MYPCCPVDALLRPPVNGWTVFRPCSLGFAALKAAGGPKGGEIVPDYPFHSSGWHKLADNCERRGHRDDAHRYREIARDYEREEEATKRGNEEFYGFKYPW